MIFGVFNMPMLKNRRRYPNLMFLLKLFKNRINVSLTLETLNFKINNNIYNDSMIYFSKLE